ncbi:MAG: thiamine phosphate synthase [Kiritimatiellaeota bacterium]|nr:thiamine phosphate synthase [Kiritimatiellota bacterium]
MQTRQLDTTLYLVTDRRLAAPRPLPAVVGEAVRNGATMVQVREKDVASREFYEIAAAVHRVTRALGVPLIVNDRLDIMLALGAEGVHVGADDLPAERVRELAPGRILGVSVGSIKQLRSAELAGADYVGVGPIFSTPTKPDAGPALGLAGLEAIVRAARVPTVAIGGIDARNAAAVGATGVSGIAVVSAIMAVPEPGTAARQLRAAFCGAA